MFGGTLFIERKKNLVARSAPNLPRHAKYIVRFSTLSLEEHSEAWGKLLAQSSWIKYRSVWGLVPTNAGQNASGET